MKIAYMPDTHGGPYNQPEPTRDEAARFCDQLFNEGIEAERAGFDGIFLPERHHRTETMFPPPLVMLAAYAARTTRVDLGTFVLQPPYYNPMHLAEDVAMIDLMSKGRVILGVGLVNDDMASHLIIADYVSDYSGVVPSFIKGGYPIGPHAVVAAVSSGTGAGLVDVFAGFTMALTPLFGLLGIGLLGKMSRPRLIVGASLVALSYLGAAYLTQGAFKEPLQAMLLIGFAVALCLSRSCEAECAVSSFQPFEDGGADGGDGGP